MNVQIHESWKEVLQEEFQKDYFQSLKNFLVAEKQQYVICPPGKLIFSAFNFTPFDDVKVVIIGQDPYHGPMQANGLSFSVNNGIASPPSLVNIFKELKEDCGCEIPTSGNLEPWAKQGVFLLNATLTVRQNTAGSHQKKGWEQFTDAAIKALSDKRENLVFLLWGNYAKEKAQLIDSQKHLVLQAAHPSPLARGAFFGSKHFSKTNHYLEQTGKKPIDWCL
ncbi:MAG: uracil-DNA glycosylase [Candidatus Fluviicola riflensis]|nr:MAG: uracil-DNA glycosylase [Candidatus Fluviicola riflensis]OGS78988.1 MAG: uracil-DNA glycosylase [Candidatus Fluviicola riflensis]OGS86010.1 MAG: uracil-DNA glycosylase [Fluviicola sp. RIFCSPHIGHO2_12_FULL_43_24]OGS86419.1 MAG: uracil-DNA glycosylase [Fluviicola sp. RIFCSPHIGHO2_01_FULL_43_53]